MRRNYPSMDHIETMSAETLRAYARRLQVESYSRHAEIEQWKTANKFIIILLLVVCACWVFGVDPGGAGEDYGR